jgi:hypothetical protein
MCTFVEGKEKLLAPKLDSFLKHQGYHKAKESRLKVDASGFFFTKDFFHAKNEECYTAVDHFSILNHLQVNVPFEQRQKYVQFVVIYHLLENGHPMIDYESLRNLFQLLKVKFVS